MPRMRSGAIFRAFRCGGGAANAGWRGGLQDGARPFLRLRMRAMCRLSLLRGFRTRRGEVRFGAWKCNMRQKKRSPCSSFLLLSPAFWGDDPCFFVCCLQFLGCLQLFRPPPWREVIGFRRRCPPPRGGRPMRRGGLAAPRCRRPSSCPSSPPRCSPPGPSPRATPGRRT